MVSLWKELYTRKKGGGFFFNREESRLSFGNVGLVGKVGWSGGASL